MAEFLRASHAFPGINLVSPCTVPKEVAAALPEECRDPFIITGSIAAGY
jgi:hypothetical protein